MAASVRLFIVMLLLYFLIFYVKGQMTPPGKEKFYAQKDDIPFIRCSVCQNAVKHISKAVNKLRESSGTKKVDEDDILNVVENSCNPDHTRGDWISKYDIIESSGVLKILEQDLSSKCKQECKTISKACEESISEVDTDLGELLWKNTLTLSKLINKVCYEMTTACSKKPPKYIKGKRKDDVFTPMSEDEKKAYDMMKQMKSMPGMPGMPGMEMYSKEDIANMKQEMSESENTNQVPPEEKKPHIPLSTNLGFFDTLKVSFQGVVDKVRRLFGYGKSKSEL